MRKQPAHLTAWLLFTMLLTALPSARTSAETTADDGALVFELEQVTGKEMLRINVPPVFIEPHFTREPKYEGSDIIRGMFPVGGDRAEHIGFAWDTRNALLWLDLNRNLDLTDDVNNRYSSQHNNRNNQLFSNIRFTSTVAGKPALYTITAELSRRGRTIRSIHVCSGWEGVVTLDGTAWRMLVVENMDGVFGVGDILNISREGDEFQEHLTDHDKSGIHVPGLLAVDGAPYEAAWDFITDERGTVLRLALTPSDIPSGTLAVEGYGITRLNLSGWLDGAAVAAVYDRPGEAVTAPAVTFNRETILIDGGDLGLLECTLIKYLTIPPNGNATLTAGFPLNNNINIYPNGPYLIFDYLLTGTGGEVYRHAMAPFSSKAPSFTIYRNGRKISSGSFRPGWGSICRYSWRVPITLSGEIAVTASRDIGDLGPVEGPPVSIDLRMSRNLFGMAIALIPWVIIVMLLRLDVNDKRSRMIVVPLAIAELLLFAAVRFAPANEHVMAIGYSILAMMFGMSALLLAAGVTGAWKRLPSYLFALAVMVMSGTVVYLTRGVLMYSGACRLYLHMYAVGAFSTVSALFIAGLFSRSGLSGFFMLKMLAALLIVSVLGESAAFLASTGNMTQFMPGTALYIVLDGIITGLFLYLAVVPVMVLVLGNGFYRERLMTLLGIGQHMENVGT